MPSIDPQALLAQMLTAGLSAAEANWPAMRNLAQDELKKIATISARIEERKLANDITEADAKLLMDLQENALRGVWIAVEGLGILTLEATINAVLGVAKGAINAATGFALL